MVAVTKSSIWTEAERAAWRPAARLRPAQWVEKHRVLKGDKRGDKRGIKGDSVYIRSDANGVGKKQTGAKGDIQRLRVPKCTGSRGGLWR